MDSLVRFAAGSFRQRRTPSRTERIRHYFAHIGIREPKADILCPDTIRQTFYRFLRIFLIEMAGLGAHGPPSRGSRRPGNVCVGQALVYPFSPRANRSSRAVVRSRRAWFGHVEHRNSFRRTKFEVRFVKIGVDLEVFPDHRACALPRFTFRTHLAHHAQFAIE